MYVFLFRKIVDHLSLLAHMGLLHCFNSMNRGFCLECLFHFYRKIRKKVVFMSIYLIYFLSNLSVYTSSIILKTH